MSKKYYLTTPIYYPSDNLHIGHTYCTVAADAIKKYKTLQGYEVYFTTGSDEHGQKLMQKAHEYGMEPKEYIDHIVSNIKDLWKTMDIDYDYFIRSTDEIHEKNVQEIFQKLYDKGEIYKSEYEGYYCTPCESFWTESQLGEGHTCPDCGRETHLAKEEAYFFRLSKYRDKLLKLYEEHPEFIQPESRKNEMVKNFLEGGLEDLSVTRSSFDWGVKVPFDDKHIVYVWIDALSCYLTGLGYGWNEKQFNEYWPADVHLVGKEIIRFHTIIWPAILMALDMPLPKQVFGHGWILFDDDKMSKSKGNVVYPEPIIKLYGVDALKYFLLREFSFGSDGSFTKEKFMSRLNSDLANDLGNLLSRTVSMVIKYNDGKLQRTDSSTEFDKSLEEIAVGIRDKVEAAMETYQFSDALEAIWTLVRRANKYVDETEPWVLAKDPEKLPVLNNVLYHLAESLRIISNLISPFLTNTSKEIRRQLGLNGEIKWEDANVFGLIKDGTTVTKGDVIFPRLDIKEEIEKLDAENKALSEKREKDLNEWIKSAGGKKIEKKEDKAEEGDEEEASPKFIGIDDFDKVRIKVALVESVEDHPNADRLYVLNLKLGDERRTIVSNIKSHYKKEDLVGRKILVITNLEPRKFRGVLSNGMLLAAKSDDGRLSLATLMEDLPDGSVVN